jgi:hypothetical protein
MPTSTVTQLSLHRTRHDLARFRLIGKLLRGLGLLIRANLRLNHHVYFPIINFRELVQKYDNSFLAENRNDGVFVN